METGAELFSWASLGTFTGLAGATVVVTNALSRAINWTPAWFGLVVALALCLGLAIASEVEAQDYILALLNACLVYVSAAGANSVGVAATAPRSNEEHGATAEITSPSSQNFFRNWF